MAMTILFLEGVPAAIIRTLTGQSQSGVGALRASVARPEAADRYTDCERAQLN
jgi:hypothetical protein